MPCSRALTSAFLVLSLFALLGSADAWAQDDDLLLYVAATTGSYNPDRDVRVTVAPFGPGSVAGSEQGVGFDSQTQSGRTAATLRRDANATFAVVATPDAGAHIAGWDGCDAVSDDLTTCVVHTGADRYVEVDFAQDAVEANATVLDISTADLDLAGDTLFVTLAPQNTWLQDAMAQLQAGDFLVATTQGSFLKQVVSITRVNALNYQLLTREASLEEVALTGTGTFTKQLTHADLAGQDSDLVAPDGSILGRIRPSADLASTVFTIDLVEGAPTGPNDMVSIKHEVTLWESGNASVKMTGTVDVQIAVDFHVDFRRAHWYSLPSLHGLRIVPEVKAKEKIELTLAGAVEGKFKKKLGTIHFSNMCFFIGIVPVVLAPQVQLELRAELGAGAEVSTSVEFTQKLRAGLEYRKHGNPSFTWPHSADLTAKFNPPKDITLTAEAKGFFNTAPLLKLYNVTGPGLDIGPYLKLTASAGPFQQCYSLESWLGFVASFKWDISGDTKVGKLIGADKLEQKAKFTLLDLKKLLKSWQTAGCDNAILAGAAVLEVWGGDFWATQRQGEAVVHEQDYVLVNTGTAPLSWTLDVSGGPVTANATSGALDPSANATVRVSVDGSGLPRGYFLSPLIFRMAGSNDIEAREIEVDVAVASLASPLLDAPTVMSEDAARLAWTYPDAATSGEVDGFYVYASTDGVAFTKLQTLAGLPAAGGEYSTVVDGLVPGTDYQFQVAAFAGEGVMSEPSAPRAFSLPALGNDAPDVDLSGVDQPHVAETDLGLTIDSADADGLQSLWLGIYNGTGELVYEWNSTDPQDTGGVSSESCVVPASSLPAGLYFYAVRAIDDTGRGTVVTGRHAVVEASGPSVELTAPIQGGTLQLGQPVTVSWTSSGLEPSAEMVIDVRSASSTLEVPDGLLWYRFTEVGADPDNDGTESVVLPSSLDTSAEDWIFCVSPAERPEIFDCSDESYTLLR